MSPEFAADVKTGAYPEQRHLVGIEPAELKAFLDRLQTETGRS